MGNDLKPGVVSFVLVLVISESTITAQRRTTTPRGVEGHLVFVEEGMHEAETSSERGREGGAFELGRKPLFREALAAF